MKAKKQKDIESLFREGLEDLRLEPSPRVWSKVSGRLYMKEFLRFSPRRFNIYYALLIVAGITALIIIATSSRGNKADTYPGVPGEQLSQTPGESILPDPPNVYDTVIVRSKSAIDSGNEELARKEKFSNISKPGAGNVIRNNTHSETAFVVPDTTVEIPVNDSNLTRTPGDSPEGKSFIMPLAMFVPSVSEGCAPLMVSFSDFSINGDRWSWSFGDGSLDDTRSPVHRFDKAGNYLVTLYVSGKDNRVSALTRIVTVHARPEAKFRIEAYGKPGSGEPVYFYNYSEDAGSYEWHFGDEGISDTKEPVWYYKKPGNYNVMLIARNSEECVDTAIMNDIFKNSRTPILFPNAFTPDLNGPGGGYYTRGDNNHDVFHPYTDILPEEYELKIFNRLGILVFESHDVHLGWDGYYQGRLQPSGVYVWQAKGRFANGETFEKMGDVTMIYHDVR